MAKVLILQNAPLFTGGTFEAELERRQIPFEYQKVFEGGLPPLEAVAHYAGIIVLGGPLRLRADEAEKNPGLAKEIFWLRAALDHHKPVIGVSQGACLLALAQGAWVNREPDKKNVGWVNAEIYPDYSRNSVIYSKVEEKKFPAFVWYDTFHGFPPTGYWYLTTPGCRYLSAGIHGNSYLFNFHPEITEDLIKSWLKEYKRDLIDPSDAERILEQTRENFEYAKGFSRKIIHAFESFLR